MVPYPVTIVGDRYEKQVCHGLLTLWTVSVVYVKYYNSDFISKVFIFAIIGN